jgi:hypothetical protein
VLAIRVLLAAAVTLPVVTVTVTVTDSDHVCSNTDCLGKLAVSRKARSAAIILQLTCIALPVH